MNVGPLLLAVATSPPSPAPTEPPREDLRLVVFMKFGGSSTMSNVSVPFDACVRYTPSDEGAATAKEKD